MHWLRKFALTLVLTFVAACGEQRELPTDDPIDTGTMTDTDTDDPTGNGGFGTGGGGGAGTGGGGTTDTDEPTEPGNEQTWWFDNDCDGVGTNPSVQSEGEPPGDDCWSLTGGDCDDDNDDRFPGNPEVDDDVDNDCDGVVDDGVGGNPPQYTHYPDADRDGYGVSSGAITDSNQAAPVGFSNLSGDCDPGNPAIHPGAPEVANGGVDDDCDPSTPDPGLPGGGSNIRRITVTPAATDVSANEAWSFYILNDTYGDSSHWFGSGSPLITGVGPTAEHEDYEARTGDLIKMNATDGQGNYLVRGCTSCAGAVQCDFAAQKCSYMAIDCGNGQVPTFSTNSWDMVCIWQ